MKPDTLSRIQSKIAAIEKEIRETPYHKGTEHHIGHLRAKLAKLRNIGEQIIRHDGGRGFAVKKSGDATIALVGPPSVGKSTLLNRLTNAKARVADWPFTTIRVIPGMMKYQGAFIQIFDLPGIIGGAASGLGRGLEVLSVARNADLLILVVDVNCIGRINSLLKELGEAEIKTPYLTVVNKADLLGSWPKGDADKMFISAEKKIGINLLKQQIWEKLCLMRIYLKKYREKADFVAPLIMKKGETVRDVARRLFSPLPEFKEVLVWGKSAKFPGQPVGLDHKLQDEDIVSFIQN